MAINKKDDEIIEHYTLSANGLPVVIDIKNKSSEFVPIYEINLPGISVATKLLISSLRNELLTMVPIDLTKIGEHDYINALTKRVFDAGKILINKYLPGTNEDTKNMLCSYMRNIMIGFGDLEAPLADENLEEIAVNSGNEYIWVFHKRIGWCKTTLKLLNDEAVFDEAEMIGRRVGREINNLAPIMDAELFDGSRVNATLFPVSQNGNTITIRKFQKNPWTMPALIKNGTTNPYIGALIWESIQNEISLLISGGTASGKTSFLNALSIFFPATRRIVSIEETRELSLPSFFQWIPMLTRMPNPEGKGEVNLYDLIINSLRQRPDIIVVGEVRVAKDAETLFEAIHTGHAVYSTLHADNAVDTIIRMTNPPINTPKIMLNALGGIIVTFRYRSTGVRKVFEFAEVTKTGDANVLYRWNLKAGLYNQIGDMVNLIDTISMYSGFTKKEIETNIEEKASILMWMVKHNILNVDDSGFIVSHFYRNKNKVLDIVKNDLEFSKDLF
ncbi:MAG: Flp pilus assembly complex ATPase component TadA [Candidatus Marsarchaeota archaeon]|jgi:flagellar protein FlaI|nr:Flp pilus assembly complex ATPase component TadA [Candidatus Marsarchaeota archaeon]